MKRVSQRRTMMRTLRQTKRNTAMEHHQWIKVRFPQQAHWLFPPWASSCDEEVYSLLENHKSAAEQTRSSAITIAGSNTHSRPQMEPFFHPKQQHVLSSPSNDVASHSLPNPLPPASSNSQADVRSTSKQNTNEKQASAQTTKDQPEEPRTPHSRAKNLSRFYPVTKEAAAVNSDVHFIFHCKSG